jgi:hypothetical protein
MVFNAVAIAVGAVMYWTVTDQDHGFRISAAGVVPIVVGAIGLITSTMMFAQSHRPAGSAHPPVTDRWPTPRVERQGCTKRFTTDRGRCYTRRYEIL